RPHFFCKSVRLGKLEAGLDRCLINRNWDGLDCYEDITNQEFVEDDHAITWIMRLRPAQWLQTELECWQRFLDRHAKSSKIELHVQCFFSNPHRLLADVVERAEQFRTLFEDHRYTPAMLEVVEQRWQALARRAQSATDFWRKHRDELHHMSCFFSECMRTAVGGMYVPLRSTSTMLGDLPVALCTPHGLPLFPIEKLLRATLQQRAPKLQLQFKMQRAHQQQTMLLEHLIDKLYVASLEQRNAAVLLASSFADSRIEQAFLQRLHLEDDPKLLARLLQRILPTMLPLPKQALWKLLDHSDPHVFCRAIRVLAMRKELDLILHLEAQLQSHKFPELDAFFRDTLVVLERKQQEKQAWDKEAKSDTHAKQAKRKKQDSSSSPSFKEPSKKPRVRERFRHIAFWEPLPPLPPPHHGFSWLVEILEQHYNMDLLEDALFLLQIFPDREEEDVLKS
ncbi:MAG: hypothetical protein AAGJ35_11490, partial [Myxococcota bacterium]